VFELAVRIVVNAIALIVALKLVPHAEFRGEWWQLLILAAIFGVINAYLKPILKLLSLPLNVITFGLFGFVVNTALVLLAAGIGGAFDLGFTLAHWPPGSINVDVIVAALLTSIVISVVSTIMAFVRFAAPRL